MSSWPRRTLLLLLFASFGRCFAQSQKVTFDSFQPVSDSDALSGIDLGRATIDNPTKARDVIDTLIGKEKFSKDAKDSAAYCIIHVLRWGEPDANTKKQAIESQNWYLYSTGPSGKANWSQEAFTQNKRLYGAHKVYLLYIHLNVQAQPAYTPNYTLTDKKKVPANIQHLLTIFQTFAPGSGTSAPSRAGQEENMYGWGVVQLQYAPSDISISSVIRTAPMSSPSTKLSDDITFDNEGFYYVDFGIAVPVKKISEVNINYSAGTAAPANSAGINPFMVLDAYIRPEDVKSSGWTRFPHAIIGIAFAKQPLNKVLLGGAWGPRFAELYMGNMWVKQPTRTSGDSCSSSNTAPVTTGKYQFCSQFSIGINLPISGIASTLGKPK